MKTTAPQVWSATFKSVGNPDYGQYSSQSPAKKVTASSAADLAKAQQKYTAAYGLGGGNWPHTKVYVNKKHVGHISYNGRIWFIEPETSKSDEYKDMAKQAEKNKDYGNAHRYWLRAASHATEKTKITYLLGKALSSYESLLLQEKSA